MGIIDKIYRVKFMRDSFSYIGTYRNSKIFNINDIIFFSINGKDIFPGKIIGIELPPTDNPEYIYKVQISEIIVSREFGYENLPDKETLSNSVINCDSIFYTIKEAKESAIKNLKKLAVLQKQEIEDYFKKFE